MRSQVVSFPCLPWVPRMVRKLVFQPDFTPASIYQTKRHIVRTTDMTKIIYMFVGPAYGDQIVACCTHASSVVTSMKRIDGVIKPARFSVDIISASLIQNLVKAGKTERIQVTAII